MNDPSQSPLYLHDAATVVPLSRVVHQVLGWTIGILATMTTALVLVFAVATQSNADSERIASGAGDSTRTILMAIAASQARPRIP